MPAAVRYTLSEGLRIAFRVDGHGPPDLVLCEPSSASFDHLGTFRRGRSSLGVSLRCFAGHGHDVANTAAEDVALAVAAFLEE